MSAKPRTSRPSIFAPHGALLRYGALVALAVVVSGGVTLLAASREGARYTAEGNLWIDAPPQPWVPDATTTRNQEVLRSNAWIELLRSYTVLESVVLDRRVQVRAARDRADAFTSFQLAEVSVEATRDAARSLSDRLVTAMDPQGNFLHVQLTGDDPVETTATLNAVMNRYVDVAADLKIRKLDESLVVLEEQLEVMETELARTERELEMGRRSPGLEITEEERLSRRVRSAENLYNEVRRQVESARLARASATPDVRILDAASISTRPRRGSRIPVAFLVFGGLVAALLGGLSVGRIGRRGRSAVNEITVDSSEHDIVPALAIFLGSLFALLGTLALLAF